MQFEDLLRITQDLVARPDPAVREVKWCDETRRLALSISESGNFEVFIPGGQLHATSALVRRHLHHGQWESDGGRYEATQIALPADPHYQPVAAFIAEELLRCGLYESVERAFARAEPIIEMAIRRTALSDNLIVGLIGELITLNGLMALAGDVTAKLRAFESWKGYEQRTRDFNFDGLGIEIKTTRNPSSAHSVSGISQVDPLRDDDGRPTEHLYLISVGLEPISQDEVEDQGFVSLPVLVNESLRLLATEGEPGADELHRLFLDRVQSYGGSVAGYDHEVMASWAVYGQAYRINFWRAYDMCDEQIQVIRRRDIAVCTAVPLDSVCFDIALPNVVDGEVNPRCDRDTFLQQVVLRRI